jgi:hypothetical protein
VKTADSLISVSKQLNTCSLSSIDDVVTEWMFSEEEVLSPTINTSVSMANLIVRHLARSNTNTLVPANHKYPDSLV